MQYSWFRSSSGYDNALYPKQPRVKSWSGQQLLGKKLQKLQNLIPETIKQNNIYRSKYKTVSSFRKKLLCKN